MKFLAGFSFDAIRRFGTVAVTIFCGASVGCFTGDLHQSIPPIPAVSPTITTPPANQSVPMGLAATFGVVASGTSLNYQWNKNGVALSGAVSAIYSTPATAFADTGDSYTVTVSNSVGSVTSSPALLTVTARAPKAGDLRFQQVDSVRTVNDFGSGGLGCPEFAFAGGCGDPIAAGSFLTIGVFSCGSLEGGCLWQFNALIPPAAVSPINVGISADYFNQFQSDITGRLGGIPPNLLAGNSAITSLNFSPNYVSIFSPAGLYGLTWAQDTTVTGV